MKFVLVDKGDNIVDRVDLQDVGVNGARTYFVGRKQIESEKFDQIWRVMTEEHYHNQYTASLQNKYDRTFKNNLYNRQMGKRKYEWWKDDDYLDIDK